MSKVQGLSGFQGGTGFGGPYGTGLSGMAGGQQMVGDMMRGTAKMQLETWALASRRAQAVLELPSRIASCKTPADLAKEQARFAQVAYANYGDATKRMTQAWFMMMGLQSFAPRVVGDVPAVMPVPAADTTAAVETVQAEVDHDAPISNPLLLEPYRVPSRANSSTQPAQQRRVA